MKYSIIKKSNPSLLQKRGRGFWGRVLILRFGEGYMIAQSRKGLGKGEAVLECIGIEPMLEILQRVYLKKYKMELVRVISFVSLPGFSENGKFFEKLLNPIGNQLEFFTRTENSQAAQVA